MSLQRIKNWRQVDPWLATSGQPTEAQLGDIAAAGYETVINLALHDDPRYSLGDEPGVVQGLGMDYVHIPVQFADPQLSELKKFFVEMDARSRQKLWVHCASNYRVSAFLGLYWVKRKSFTSAQAFELMRGIWTPDDTWATFIERALIEQI